MYFLGISVASLVIGSAFILRGATWYSLAVSPGLAIVVSILIGGFFWIVTKKILEADDAPDAIKDSGLSWTQAEQGLFMQRSIPGFYEEIAGEL